MRRYASGTKRQKKTLRRGQKENGMDDLNDDEGFRAEVRTFLKLRCLELADRNAHGGEDVLELAERYFAWLARDEEI